MLFVIALQQAPGAGVIADYSGNGLAFIRNQTLIGKRAAEQIDGLLKLYAALCKAALIEGVALNQMIFEYLRCPLAKLCCALRADPITNGDNGIGCNV